MIPAAELRGDTFDLHLDPDGEELVATVARGRPVVEQVLRRLNCQPGRVVRDNGDLLAVAAKASLGEDRAIYKRGLSHRLLYRRSWDRSGRHAVWVGFNPFLAEFEGDPYDTAADDRKSFQVVYSAAHGTQAPLASLAIVNLFTQRTKSAIDLTDTTPGQENLDTIDDAIAGADVVICAWGKLRTAELKAARPRARHIVEIAAQHNVKVTTLSKDGGPAWSGGYQLRHPSRGFGYRGVSLAVLPEGWVERMKPR